MNLSESQAKINQAVHDSYVKVTDEPEDLSPTDKAHAVLEGHSQGKLGPRVRQTPALSTGLNGAALTNVASATDSVTRGAGNLINTGVKTATSHGFGSIGLIVALIILLLLVVIPSGTGYTRLQSIWLVLIGKANLTSTGANPVVPNYKKGSTAVSAGSGYINLVPNIRNPFSIVPGAY